MKLICAHVSVEVIIYDVHGKWNAVFYFVFIFLKSCVISMESYQQKLS